MGESTQVAGAVVVTGLVPEDPAAWHTESSELLHPWEREQSRQFTRETRARYVHVHVAAHLWAAGVLGVEPGAVEITRRPCLRCRAEHGAPQVVVDGHSSYFSTTRTGRHYAFALSSRPVGVDLETIRSTLDVDAVAHVACSDTERAHLAGLSPAHARATFFRWWAAKEAVTKATGHGLKADFRTVVASGTDASSTWEFDGTAWHVAEVRVDGSDVVGAVAVPPSS
ncbi:4'-phosphopantetheinyl transferase family protein [Cellulomonas xiejunii]|uniref:4'-phosphopantetheinyl transferase family protein n=1 Tax=Cellulomonas xiejunii TaxID=2968083 RepID=UPI001D0E547B|nr:4'-phosphopantetheinyl transferase superfamily protein [Cellulomonas xiejunii]MCC2314668.1 4'-phosphopantetheinyl transferase superfamily protein [Cellulomonas xiejunii]